LSTCRHPTPPDRHSTCKYVAPRHRTRQDRWLFWHLRCDRPGNRDGQQTGRSLGKERPVRVSGTPRLGFDGRRSPVGWTIARSQTGVGLVAWASALAIPSADSLPRGGHGPDRGSEAGKAEMSHRTIVGGDSRRRYWCGPHFSDPKPTKAHRLAQPDRRLAVRCRNEVWHFRGTATIGRPSGSRWILAFHPERPPW
jgi:hypothetical protein